MPNTDYTEVVRSTYDPKITLKKFLTGLLMAIAPVALLYSITFVEGTDFPEEYALYAPIILGILHALLNLVKHWGDTEIVKVSTKTGEIIN